MIDKTDNFRERTLGYISLIKLLLNKMYFGRLFHF